MNVQTSRFESGFFRQKTNKSTTKSIPDVESNELFEADDVRYDEQSTKEQWKTSGKRKLPKILNIINNKKTKRS